MEKLLDRIVTIIFIIALIAIIYFVAQYVSQRMLHGETNDIEIEVDEDDFVLDSEDVDDTYDSEAQDYYDEDGLAGKDVPEEYNDEIASIMEDVTGGETEETETPSETKEVSPSNTSPKAATEEVEEEETEETSSPKTNQSTGNEPRYMIVAGSFTSKPNAEEQMKVLEKEGYSPELVNFNGSKMFTVVAARYNNKGSANAAAKQLKGKKVECYVHTKRLK